MRFVRKTMSGRAVVMVLAALIMGAAVSFASTTVGIIDWDPLPGTAWVGTNVNVDVSVIATNSDPWLEVAFTNTVPPDILVYGSASNLFAGTWSSEFWIEFDFWADTQADSVQVRWGAGGGSTNIWGQTVTPSGGLNSWQTLRTGSLGDDSAWDIGLGDPSEYLADLSSIDWIGVYIDRNTTSGADNYGIDDFSLMVPEPAEILMLAAAFGVGLLVFRRMRLVPVGR